MSDLIPGSLYAFSNLAPQTVCCSPVKYTTESINNAFAISLFQKKIAAGSDVFLTIIFDKCPT